MTVLLAQNERRHHKVHPKPLHMPKITDKSTCPVRSPPTSAGPRTTMAAHIDRLRYRPPIIRGVRPNLRHRAQVHQATTSRSVQYHHQRQGARRPSHQRGIPTPPTPTDSPLGPRTPVRCCLLEVSLQETINGSKAVITVPPTDRQTN